MSHPNETLDAVTITPHYMSCLDSIFEEKTKASTPKLVMSCPDEGPDKKIVTPYYLSRSNGGSNEKLVALQSVLF